jgi:hypothetical protein
LFLTLLKMSSQNLCYRFPWYERGCANITPQSTCGGGGACMLPPALFLISSTKLISAFYLLFLLLLSASYTLVLLPASPLCYLNPIPTCCFSPLLSTSSSCFSFLFPDLFLELSNILTSCFLFPAFNTCFLSQQLPVSCLLLPTSCLQHFSHFLPFFPLHIVLLPVVIIFVIFDTLFNYT